MRTAVVGIDGTGKTTVLRRMRERGDIAVVHAIRAHDDPHSPYAALSRALAGASAAADALGRVQLKLAVLYLQLCLYGPTERQASRNGRPLVSDRHPLIDPLAYLPMFARTEREDAPGADVEAWWRGQEPRGARAVRDWLVARTASADPWPLGTDLLHRATRPPQDILDYLSRSFGVTLPNAVVLLDLPVEDALARTRDRESGGELHETADLLSLARQHYDTALAWLSRARPEVSVHRVDCRGRTAAEVTEAVRAVVTREGKGRARR
ncbi:hypothetical protein [Streptomyces soliscabiei]|uniref:hypothetical protein n=1 Tax=Streptomyces soliscabiei TaxID=588897 RepID=UPI0029AA254C|nr:hypothetical protein [Streptomyces sp. NY05-11A]MDX2682478.1 hypothetical protein [Streptomyces sp. NY05-11A]